MIQFKWKIVALLLLLVLNVPIAKSCTTKTSTTSTSGSSSLKSSPAPPTAVASTCGHSKYYYAQNSPGSGIVGGTNAKINQFPWIVRLLIKATDGTYLCGGTIISESYILTAAHCMESANPSDVKAIIGDYDTQSTDTGEVTASISKIIIHPNYEASSQNYDFTLLKLTTPLNFARSWTVQKICLPTSCADSCTTGSGAYIAGWGTLSSGGSTPRYLQVAYVEIGSSDVCNQQYNSITDKMICAGYLAGGVDTCQGDSGGPLMSVDNGYYTLCGVTSFGNGCAEPNYYGVYARVCSELDWIYSNILSTATVAPTAATTTKAAATTTTTKTTTKTTTTTTKATATALATPAPVASVCGHSKYYYSSNQPGAGIVGGVTAQQNQYPWLARLSIKKSSSVYLCGASIISENYLLTAAHCMMTTIASDITATFADHDSYAADVGEFSIVGSSITIHPLYNSTTYDNDLALIRLSKPLNFTASWTVQKICLPTSCTVHSCGAGTTGYIAGWGTTSASSSTTARYLQAAAVQIADQSVCTSQYSSLTNNMICAGYLSGGVDTCSGDSGGPLMSMEDGYYKLCGVTSYGYGCALANHYGVYARVCSQVSWIKSNAGIS